MSPKMSPEEGQIWKLYADSIVYLYFSQDGVLCNVVLYEDEESCHYSGSLVGGQLVNELYNEGQYLGKMSDFSDKLVDIFIKNGII